MKLPLLKRAGDKILADVSRILNSARIQCARNVNDLPKLVFTNDPNNSFNYGTSLTVREAAVIVGDGAVKMLRLMAQIF
jgi:hypothetical protein